MITRYSIQTKMRRARLVYSPAGGLLLAWSPKRIMLFNTSLPPSTPEWCAGGEDIAGCIFATPSHILHTDDGRLLLKDAAVGHTLRSLDPGDCSADGDIHELHKFPSHSFALCSGDATYSFTCDAEPADCDAPRMTREYEPVSLVEYHPSGNLFAAITALGTYETISVGECDYHGVHKMLNTLFCLKPRILAHGFSNSGSRYAVISADGDEVVLYVFHFPSLNLLHEALLTGAITDVVELPDTDACESVIDYTILSYRYPFRIVFVSDDAILIFPDSGGVATLTWKDKSTQVTKIAQTAPIRDVCVEPSTREVTTVDVGGEVAIWDLEVARSEVADGEYNWRSEKWFRESTTDPHNVGDKHIDLLHNW